MSWFKTKITESTERRKTSFSKKTVKNAHLHKAVLDKSMTTKGFIAPLKNLIIESGSKNGCFKITRYRYSY